MNPSRSGTPPQLGAGCDLDDELARIASDVQALALRHGITDAAAIDTPNLIRALHTIARNRPAQTTVEPIHERTVRHLRQVADVRASLMLGDPTERHNCYSRRPLRTA